MTTTWVIPTVNGREESLERSLAYVEDRTDIQLVIVKNRPTCGAAWVEGAMIADGQNIYFAADDIAAHDGFIEKCRAANNEYELPAARVVLPGGGLQSCGGISSGVCSNHCRDGQLVEWSPTPFIKRDWWHYYLDEHKEILKELHYSSDRLISAVLAKRGIPSVYTHDAAITHWNDPVGRLWTAGGDASLFDSYRVRVGI